MCVRVRVEASARYEAAGEGRRRRKETERLGEGRRGLRGPALRKGRRAFGGARALNSRALSQWLPGRRAREAGRGYETSSARKQCLVSNGCAARSRRTKKREGRPARRGNERKGGRGRGRGHGRELLPPLHRPAQSSPGRPLSPPTHPLNILLRLVLQRQLGQVLGDARTATRGVPFEPEGLLVGRGRLSQRVERRSRQGADTHKKSRAVAFPSAALRPEARKDAGLALPDQARLRAYRVSLMNTCALSRATWYVLDTAR